MKPDDDKAAPKKTGLIVVDELEEIASSLKLDYQGQQRSGGMEGSVYLKAR